MNSGNWFWGPACEAFLHQNLKKIEHLALILSENHEKTMKYAFPLLELHSWTKFWRRVFSAVMWSSSALFSDGGWAKTGWILAVVGEAGSTDSAIALNLGLAL